MSKRFIETEIFEDTWFMELSVQAKLLYIYFFTKCDHAGLLDFNPKLCEFQTNIKNIDSCLKEIDSRVIRLENGLYFLPKFFKRQYPHYPKKAWKAAISAHEKLDKLGLWNVKTNKVTLTQHLPNSSEEEAELSEDIEPVGEEEQIETQVELWNFFAENYNLTKVIKLTAARKAHVKARLKEKDFDLEHILRLVEKSEFLLGKSSDWKITFDFIFSSKNNWVKIMEGNYNGRNVQGNSDAELKRIFADIAKDDRLR